ncbi:hypothetical protein M1V28_31710 (plasmid) [Pseudomonas aeruginosa]|uniref:hypothetical protein n=1 Tax=Pseudomonas aeruginosa TaxID=287 RepID=UPI001A18846F|nr:hypothetical protein [Pseudomonas aeruginosa]MBH4314800.1 hypothetical protein [Pseudomonas aeruginosa]MBH8699130.1 hypothetical protein [Pseudomonas aeruginosa]WBM10973.1 hypothetical protein M1V28_31710 [Pseudomonas aeruginosa]HEK3608709.1 hypothetical protein [Pseudomonas aeruginosa]
MRVMQIDAMALGNMEAMPYARRVAIDSAAGIPITCSIVARKVPTELAEHVTAILVAVDEGWFMIPDGPDLTYSKRQFGMMSRCAERSPWLRSVINQARVFERAVAPLKAPSPGFGVDKLPNWLTLATNACHRLHRLPLEHQARTVTVALFLQCLQDSQSYAGLLQREMECFTPEWMWDASYPLAEQVQRITRMECMHYLKPYVSTTRNRSLGTFEQRLLQDVQYHGLSIDAYQSRMQAEEMRLTREAEASWALNFSLIRRLASILDGATSYHHGTLTRRLRAESNGAFKLIRSTSGEMTLEIRYQYELGRGKGYSTPFQLVNYCLALADELEKASPTFTDYLDASDRASRRLERAGCEAANSNHTPRRDFDFS